MAQQDAVIDATIKAAYLDPTAPTHGAEGKVARMTARTWS
jgi:hypothetical protein